MDHASNPTANPPSRNSIPSSDVEPRRNGDGFDEDWGDFVDSEDEFDIEAVSTDVSLYPRGICYLIQIGEVMVFSLLGLNLRDYPPKKTACHLHLVCDAAAASLEKPSPGDKPQIEHADYQQTHLRKRSTLVSTIAFGFITMNSWVAFASGLAVPVSCGAGPTLIYGLLVRSIVMSILASGYAELASAFPSAGGQYHIVYMIFPASTQRFAAFFTGRMSILYTMGATASCSFFVAQSILNLVALWNETYVIQSWRVYLVHICLCTIAFLAASRFPAAIGSIGVSVFLDVNYRLHRIACNALGSSRSEAAHHLSEEVDNPSRNIPIVIGATIILGVITAIGWNIGLMYVIKDVQGLIASGAPIMEVYNQALGSKTATTIWSVYYILVIYNVTLNLLVFSSRILWSFARDGGVPYSSYVSRLRWSNPVLATAIMLFLQIIIGILYIASKTAYSSFINLTLFAFNITVVLPQTVLLFTGRDSLPKRAFSLGRYGSIANALATIFMPFFDVVLAFPVARPVTGSSMNYLVVILQSV
ncbi:hypothetical protein NW761_012434 [Fusarium oxysporum]|nr:hypothetical protein NW763_006730 [Fusarium oxysporum]KAJ4076896.1 hypothetical protein NW761_012434 [Fusarium oxysporum]KAJ4104362.1 hypothetical protein NW756_000119 [Fusarium oxysporum]